MPAGKEAAAKPKVKDERGLLTILAEECLKRPSIWLFAISYFWVTPIPGFALLPSPLQCSICCVSSFRSSACRIDLQAIHTRQ